MDHLRLAKKNKEKKLASWKKLKKHMIERKIRAKYDVSDELGILRQKDTKPTEYAEYFEYVEKCKAEVNAELEID